MLYLVYFPVVCFSRVVLVFLGFIGTWKSEIEFVAPLDEKSDSMVFGLKQTVETGCQTVKIACGKSAETAVAKARIRLTIVEFFYVHAKIFECRSECLLKIKVIKIIAK